MSDAPRSDVGIATAGHTIRQLSAGLADGSVTAATLVAECLKRIAAPDGEGGRAFLSVAAETATETAAAYDGIRAAGGTLPPFAGIPVAVKDLADIAGQVTTAGSVVLADRSPAVVDAPVVARLRAAGFIIVGRTNMTEFAYSGLGLNSHHDTPRSPWDRETGRIPGGSSSGTAVAVADGMAVAGLGTDTGGSCRIPAAFCGVVGFKPTASRVPLHGVVPLSFSLDSIGPLGRSVDCCAIVDDVFASGSGLVANEAPPPERLRFGMLTDLVLDDMAPEVAVIYERTLASLADAGVTLVDVSFPELNELPEINRGGGLAAAEAFAWHRDLLADRGDEYDQRVRSRMELGAKLTAADYIDVLEARKRLIAVAEARMDALDGFVLPTVPILPPPVADLDDGDAALYSTNNLLTLRNTSVGNFLDTCALSVPANAPDEPPVGFMLMGRPQGDRPLLAAGRTVERILAG
ncbi:MAG: amidase [Actinomycetota bacterium]